MRIDCGPGYRVDFTKLGFTLIILLAGGDKKHSGPGHRKRHPDGP